MHGQLREEAGEVFKTLCGCKKVEIAQGATCAPAAWPFPRRRARSNSWDSSRASPRRRSSTAAPSMAASSGNVSEDTLRKYIESQG
jgi:hypothetical protein